MKKAIVIFLISFLIPLYSHAMTVVIEWDPVTVTAPKVIDHYNIYQSPISGVYTGSSVIVRSVPANKTAIKITGLLNQTLYFIVKAVDNYGNESIACPEVTTKWFIILINNSKYCPSNQKYWN